METLELLPFEKWIVLRDSMGRDWPKYAYFYNYLNKSIEWKTKDPSIKDNFYCPNANAESGVCISITENMQSVYLFSFNETKNTLKEILRTTDKIDWSRTFQFDSIHESIQDILEHFLITEAKRRGMRNYTKENFACHLKAKEDCLKLTVEIPEECELKSIEEHHIPLINTHWRHRNVINPERSIYNLAKRTKLNGSYGLFLKKDNSLVSWILQCNRGCLAVLNTLEEYRRKGYGKIVTRALARYIAENDGTDVTVYADECNENGAKFYESMGFERVANLAWYDVNYE